MTDNKLSNKQRVDKIAKLFSQIEKISFGSVSLSMHSVPVLALDSNWKVDKKFMDDGVRHYFIAEPKNKKPSDFGITFFGETTKMEEKK